MPMPWPQESDFLSVDFKVGSDDFFADLTDRPVVIAIAICPVDRHRIALVIQRVYKKRQCLCQVAIEGLPGFVDMLLGFDIVVRGEANPVRFAIDVSDWFRIGAGKLIN